MKTKPLTADEQHDELTNSTVRIYRLACSVDDCDYASESFDDEMQNVFVDRSLDEGWQVFGKKKELLCPICSKAKGLSPVV